jgi:hypothetical protein
MRHPARSTVLLSLLGLAAAAALLAPAVSAQDDAATETPAASTNAVITITVGDTVPEDGNGPDERSYRMVNLVGGRMAHLMMGWRMPIPTTRQPVDDPDGEPVTAYVYQNVGMSAHLETRMLVDGKVLVKGNLEVSGKRNEPQAERDEAGLPIIGTFQQDVYLVMRDGKKLRVAEVPDPEGGTIYIDMQIDLMD